MVIINHKQRECYKLNTGVRAQREMDLLCRWRAPCSTDNKLQVAAKAVMTVRLLETHKRRSVLFTPTLDSRWLLETTAAGLLALISPVRVLWETASPATAFSPCQHPTAERSVRPGEHRERRGVPTRSWGLAAETATVFRPELRRLRRTSCSSPLRQVLRQPEPWPPRRPTWQPPQRQTRPRRPHRPPLRQPRPCSCTESQCTTGRRRRARSRRGLLSSSTTKCSVTFIF